MKIIWLVFLRIFSPKSMVQKSQPGRISLTLMDIAYVRVCHEVHRGLGILVHQPRALVSVLISIAPNVRI